MTAIGLLVPLSIIMGITGLLAFLWSLRARQYEDLDGAAARILLENDEDTPVVDRQRNLAEEGDSDDR